MPITFDATLTNNFVDLFDPTTGQWRTVTDPVTGKPLVKEHCWGSVVLIANDFNLINGLLTPVALTQAIQSNDIRYPGLTDLVRSLLTAKATALNTFNTAFAGKPYYTAPSASQAWVPSLVLVSMVRDALSAPLYTTISIGCNPKPV